MKKYIGILFLILLLPGCSLIRKTVIMSPLQKSVTKLEFRGVGPLTFSLKNWSDVTVRWVMYLPGTYSWILIKPAEGKIEPGESQLIWVRVDPKSIKGEGMHMGVITLLSDVNDVMIPVFYFKISSGEFDWKSEEI